MDPGLLECCFRSQPLCTFALGLATVWLSGRGAYLKEMAACDFIRLPLLSTCGSGVGPCQVAGYTNGICLGYHGILNSSPFFDVDVALIHRKCKVFHPP